MKRICLTALAVALAAPALAQDATVPAEYLAVVDADGDGAVSLDEMKSAMGSAFAELDANADGYLDWDEAKVTMRVEHFSGADSNGDNGLSQTEYMVQVERDFEASDQDGDGLLN